MFLCWTFFFSDKISEGNLTFQKRHTSGKKKKRKRKKEHSSHSETEYVQESSTCLTASPRQAELPDIIPRQVCQVFSTPVHCLSVSFSSQLLEILFSFRSALSLTQSLICLFLYPQHFPPLHSYASTSLSFIFLCIFFCIFFSLLVGLWQEKECGWLWGSQRCLLGVPIVFCDYVGEVKTGPCFPQAWSWHSLKAFWCLQWPCLWTKIPHISCSNTNQDKRTCAL